MLFLEYSDLEPVMADLNTIVVPRIQADWEDVAYALRYKISTVKSIKEKNRDDPKNVAVDSCLTG